MLRRYKVFSADAEVHGVFVRAFYEWENYQNIVPFLMQHGLLGRHGFRTVDPDQWYPQQIWLDVLNDLVDSYGGMCGDLVSIGMTIFDTADFWHRLDNQHILSVLDAWKHDYFACHRATDPGQITIQHQDSAQIRVATRLPYPDELIYGLLYAMVRHFCPEGMDFVLKYDDTLPRRGDGGRSTVFLLTVYQRSGVQSSPPPADLMANLADITQVIELPVVINNALLQNQVLNEQEVVLRVNGHNAHVVISLRPSFGGDYRSSGSMVLLRAKDRRPRQEAPPASEQVTLENLAAYSPSMRPVVRQSQIAARGTAPVLLHGESGVGKTFLARAIHSDSPRREQPFVTVSARTMTRPWHLYHLLGLVDEASERVPADVTSAQVGTLFIDDLDLLDLDVQYLLLQIMETDAIIHPDHTHMIDVDARVMAATAANVEHVVAEGRLLRELYYRFGVFNIHVPPLRERTKDLPYLIRACLRTVATDLRQRNRQIDIEDDALSLLCRYPWPGNLREMESVLAYAVIQRDEWLIRVGDLPESVRSGHGLPESTAQPVGAVSLAEAEREAILKAGWASQGRIADMVEILGIGRTTLWRKLRELNISTSTFKQMRS